MAATAVTATEKAWITVLLVRCQQANMAVTPKAWRTLPAQAMTAMDIHININKENFMKKMILAALMVVFATAANAGEGAHKLRKVDAEFVCMVNNMAYEKQQVEAVVEGKTYYGCCPMCKEKLEKNPALRKAIDPVSGKEVDKADAVIGAMEDGMVHYFENEANLEKFSVEMKHDGKGSNKESHSGHQM